MARKAREKSSTGNYAVMLKSVSEIFTGKTVKEMFRECAEKYLGEGLKGIRFSKGQVDMLIHESEKGISMDMKPLMTSFARLYNKSTGNEGKIFADRFKSVPVEIDEDYELCLKYIAGSGARSPFGGTKKAPSAAENAAEKEKPVSEKNKAPRKSPVSSAKKTDVTPHSETEDKAKENKPQPKPEKNDLPIWLL